MSDLSFGTCSWKYDSWKGIVYSENEKINYLKEYSQKFNSVEIDQWFWSLGKNKITLPNRNIVEAYKLSVPKNFKFTIKVPNSLTLTHLYRKKKSDPLILNTHFLDSDLYEQFLYSIEPIHSQVRCLMFQFEYLNKEKMNSLTAFIEKWEEFLLKINRNITIGIEIRNPNYLDTNYFNFLYNHKISPVFLQGYYMPNIWENAEKYLDILSSPIIIRLHGPDRKGIEKRTGGIWNQRSEPKIDELQRVAELIKILLNKNLEVFVNVNNHYEGSAPLTIEALKNLLK